MSDQNKTKTQLIAELESLRTQVAKLEVERESLKQSQQALQDSEQKYRLILDNIDEIAYIVGVTADNPYQAPIQFVSHRVENIIGYKPEDFFTDLGLWFKLLCPEDIPVLQESTQQILSTRQGGTRFYRIRHKQTGEYRWMEDKVLPLLDDSGNVIATFGAARDITYRLQAEESLRESQRRYAGLFNNALDAILIADDQANYVDANPAACALLGYSQEELLQMTVWDVTPIPNRELGQALWQQFIAAGNQSGEYALLRRDGVILELEYRAVANIAPGLHLSILRDITKRKQAEKVLQEHRQRLQSLSKRLFDIQEVERRQIALELHDQLGQMLTVVKLNLQAALRQKIKSKIKPYVVDSIATVEAVMRQVRDISLNLRPHILDNLGLLAALRWYVDRQTQQSGLIIRFTATNLETRPAPDIEIACFRVTQETLTNIIKHAGAREVLVELQQHDTELSLIIRDDGKGLDLPVALAGAARGETIGLSGMQERVELYGGRLEINSQPGRGAELCARFPLAPDSSP